MGQPDSELAACLRAAAGCRICCEGGRLLLISQRHPGRFRPGHRCAVPDQHRSQLHHPELSGWTHNQLQLLHAAGPDRAALGRRLRQRQLDGQHVVRCRPRAQDLAHQRLAEHASAQLSELPHPGREDRQVDPLRADHRHDRRAVHLPAHDPRAVRPGRQRRRSSSTTRDRPTTCTASPSGTTSTRRAPSSPM